VRRYLGGVLVYGVAIGNTVAAPITARTERRDSPSAGL
jgi:hypothetical protein